MVYEKLTPLASLEIFARAKRFFAERVPLSAAYPEQEGPTHLVLRGQGGEEIAIAALPGPDGVTRIRASTLFFDQVLDRFLETLPPAPEAAA
jgi:hypothetical protein